MTQARSSRHGFGLWSSVALCLLFAAPAFSQSYGIAWYSVDGGGASASAGGTFTLAGSIGQPDAGALSGGSYALSGGFMSAFAATPALGPVSSSNITATTADLSASVSSDGGSSITERGFVYSVNATNANPVIGGPSVTKVAVSGTTGLFSATVASLAASTQYAFNAFATNGGGTIYGSVSTFTTSTPVLSINDVSALEGNSSAQNYTFTVTLSAPSASTVTVAFATQNGSATAGADYAAASGSLTFNPGETSKTLAVSVLGDTLPEPDEAFSVVLGTPVNAAIVKATGAGVIRNDDGGSSTPGVSISDPSVQEGNSGASLLSFTISLSAVSASAVTVDYATSNGTATAGSDYTAGSGTFTIPAGVLSKNLVLVVQGDDTVEADETLLVTLSGPVNAALLKGAGLGTIVNDDPATTATTVTQYRLYHDGTKEHLYTTDLNEYTVLGTVGWIQEGIAYKMLTSGNYGGVATVPLFRMYHPGILQHHWTTDSNETTVLTGTPFWFYEGIVGYVAPSQVTGTIPLYRMALASPALHLWTTDFNEYTVLQTRGWIPEGIIGYVVP